MIGFVDTPARQEELFRLCEGSALGCKLAAVAGAYGFEQGFAQFWVDGSAAYCLLDGELTICGVPREAEEAGAFANMLGPGAVLCSDIVARSMGMSGVSGPVLEKALPPGEAVQPPEPPKLGDICLLLDQAGMPVEFEHFYLDMSHRLRHGVAMALGEFNDGGRLVGCGVVSAVTERAALLSALAVDQAHRRRGIGSRIVRRVEAALPGRNLYVLREDGKNQEFYRRLGFLEVDRWVQATKKQIKHNEKDVQNGEFSML